MGHYLFFLMHMFFIGHHSSKIFTAVETLDVLLLIAHAVFAILRVREFIRSKVIDVDKTK